MAKERRQFIGLTNQQAQAFDGLPNEITVSTDSKTLRVHTAEEPHGILLAKQSDLSSTSETVSQQGEAISGLDGRVTTLEENANGDMRGFTHTFNYICNDVNTNVDTSTLYPYKKAIYCQHFTPTNHDTIAYVMLDASDAVSGNFAPFADYDGYNGILTIYSKVEGQTTHSGRVALVDIRRADTNG